MNARQHAERFHSLHAAGNPVILYNVWDAGSAQAVEQAGAQAIATGSWSVAAAQGYDDGEAIPLSFVEKIVSRVCATVSLPVTVDLEGGYAGAPAEVASNAARLVDAGGIGINFEDRVVKGEGLYDIAEQAERIRAIRGMAEHKCVRLFINARTDLFLQGEPATHATLIDDAVARARAYAKAGASGFFVPGLRNSDLIGDLCANVGLPVNIMMMDGSPTALALSKLGVSRISYGPAPYRAAMNTLTEAARTAFISAKKAAATDSD